MRTLISLLFILFFTTACASGPSKSELDAEVARLCAIDGGIKVYETVTLPPEKFNKYRQVNFYRPTQGENALGPEYLISEETNFYRQGNPQMARHHYRLLRRSDQKLLGETILYGRGGGDLTGPWHESSFTCPSYAEAGVNALMKRIFIHKE